MSKLIRIAVIGFLATAGADLLSAAEYNTSVKKTPLLNWPTQPKPASLAKTDPTAVAKEIDQLLAEDLAAADDSTKVIKFDRRATDEVFLRRVYLDFIGRNPTPDEVTAFVLDASPDKRGRVIDHLLDDSRFGENWARYWRDVIMYRRSDDRARTRLPSSVRIPDHRVQQERPLGSNRPFVYHCHRRCPRKRRVPASSWPKMATRPTSLPKSRASSSASKSNAHNCHDHKTDRWKREQFHQLAAFFPRIAVRPVKLEDDKRSFEVVSNDRPIKINNPKLVNRPVGSPEHLMPDLKHPEFEGTKMQPVFFLTGQSLPFGTPDSQRRDTIAKWITSPSDEWFAKAFVNRVWAELVGEGFYDPIDDIGPDRTCSAPKTIDCLAHEFVDSHYDVKRLYRIIASTDAYQRNSRTRRNPDEMPFAANCPERLRGDQVYDALIAALGMNDAPGVRLSEAMGGKGGKGALFRSPRNQFDQVFGFDPSTPRDEVTGSIPQALLLMNGPQINRASTPAALAAN